MGRAQWRGGPHLPLTLSSPHSVHRRNTVITVLQICFLLRTTNITPSMLTNAFLLLLPFNQEERCLEWDASQEWTGRDSDRPGTSLFCASSHQGTLSWDSLERPPGAAGNWPLQGLIQAPGHQPLGAFSLKYCLSRCSTNTTLPFLPHWDHLPAAVHPISSSRGPLWLN